MKHLTDYIKESIEIDLTQVNESSNNKWFRIDVSDFSGAYDSLKSIADQKKLYNEPIDNGIKIEVKEGQAELLSAIIEFLTDLVNSKQEDGKLDYACQKLMEVVDEMNEYMEDKTEKPRIKLKKKQKRQLRKKKKRQLRKKKKRRLRKKKKRKKMKMKVNNS